MKQPLCEILQIMCCSFVVQLSVFQNYLWIGCQQYNQVQGHGGTYPSGICCCDSLCLCTHHYRKRWRTWRLEAILLLCCLSISHGYHACSYKKSEGWRNGVTLGSGHKSSSERLYTCNIWKKSRYPKIIQDSWKYVRYLSHFRYVQFWVILVNSESNPNLF